MIILSLHTNLNCVQFPEYIFWKYYMSLDMYIELKCYVTQCLSIHSNVL